MKRSSIGLHLINGTIRGIRGGRFFFSFFSLFVWFVSFSIRIVFSPILPIVEDEFLVSHAKASAIFTFRRRDTGCQFPFRVFSGRIGYKRSLFSPCAPQSPGILIARGSRFYVLYLYAFVLGFAHGGYIPSAIPLITEY